MRRSLRELVVAARHGEVTGSRSRKRSRERRGDGKRAANGISSSRPTDPEGDCTPAVWSGGNAALAVRIRCGSAADPLRIRCGSAAYPLRIRCVSAAGRV